MWNIANNYKFVYDEDIDVDNFQIKFDADVNDWYEEYMEVKNNKLCVLKTTSGRLIKTNYIFNYTDDFWKNLFNALSQIIKNY